jgi:hypothetical protein
VRPASRTWRRDVGALAWAALEELALSARQDDQGWASPAGIRAIATGIGTTEAAVLGAIAALGRAGLVALEPVTDQYGTAAADIGCISHTASSCATLRVTTTASSRACLAEVATTRTMSGRSAGRLIPPTQESGGLTEPPPHHPCSGSHPEEQP